MAVCCSASVLSLPCIDREPVQPPLAVQAVAFVAVQDKSVDAPGATVLSVAVMDTVGAGAASTFTEAASDAVPPGPVQVSMKVVACVSVPVVSLPSSDFEPDQPSLATQAVAFVADQVNVVDPR